MTLPSVASPSAINTWAILSGVFFIASIVFMAIFDYVSPGRQGVYTAMWACSGFIAFVLSIAALVDSRKGGRWIAIVVLSGCVVGCPAILFLG